MAQEGLNSGTDDSDLDVELPEMPQPFFSPRRLDFPSRTQAAMNAVDQLPTKEAAMLAFEVLKQADA